MKASHLLIVEVASHSCKDVSVGNLIIQGFAERVLIWGGIAALHEVTPDIAAIESDPVKIQNTFCVS